jgi:hypothetical protein
MLSVQGITEANVMIGMKFPDLNRIVNEKSTEIEINIFCDNPFLIGEATTFLRHTEMDKVAKLLRVHDFLGRQFQLFHIIIL